MLQIGTILLNIYVIHGYLGPIISKLHDMIRNLQDNCTMTVQNNNLSTIINGISQDKGEIPSNSQS